MFSILHLSCILVPLSVGHSLRTSWPTERNLAREANLLQVKLKRANTHWHAIICISCSALQGGNIMSSRCDCISVFCFGAKHFDLFYISSRRLWNWVSFFFFGPLHTGAGDTAKQRERSFFSLFLFFLFLFWLEQTKAVLTAGKVRLRALKGHFHGW